jgi:mobilome CxxCx(11)CxxC protein
LTGQPAYDAVRSQCWDEAIKTYGTSYIFKQRARRFKLKLQLLSFIGLGVPLTVGLIVLSFGTGPEALPWVLSVAAILGGIQAVVSLWSLVSGWNEAHAYARVSVGANDALSNSFRTLAQNPPASYGDLKARFDLLQVENRNRTQLDLDQGVRDSEQRLGMRSGLRQFGRKCKGCGKVPTSMEPTDCDVWVGEPVVGDSASLHHERPGRAPGNIQPCGQFLDRQVLARRLLPRSVALLHVCLLSSAARRTRFRPSAAVFSVFGESVGDPILDTRSRVRLFWADDPSGIRWPPRREFSVVRELEKRRSAVCFLGNRYRQAEESAEWRNAATAREASAAERAAGG